MADETLVMTIDARPAEDGGRRYARTIDEVTKANEKADSATDKLEERFRSLAKTTTDGVKSLAGWVFHHSLLLGAVSSLSKGLSFLATGAMGVFLVGVSNVTSKLSDLTNTALTFAAKGLRSMSVGVAALGGSFAGLARALATGATWMERFAAISGGLSLGMTVLAGAATAAGIAIASAAAKASASFTPAFNRVRTLLSGTSAESEALRRQVSLLAGTMGVDGVESANALYNIVSAMPELAKDTAGAMAVLDPVLAATATGFTDATEAAAAITGILNAFNLKATDATRVSDALFAAQQQGVTTFGEIAGSIGTVGDLAASLGGRFEDLLGILATTTDSGVTTAERFTQLRGVISAIVKPTTQATEALQGLDVDLSAASLRTKGLNNFLLDLIAATKGNPDVLAKVFPQESLGLILSLARQTDVLRQKTDEIASSAGKTTAVLGTMNESWEAQRRILHEGIQTELRTIGDGFGEMGVDALKGINLAVAGLNRLEAWLGRVNRGAKEAEKSVLRVAPRPEGILDATDNLSINPNRRFPDAFDPAPLNFSIPRAGASPAIVGRPTPEIATLEHATEKVQKLSDSLRAAAAIKLNNTGDFAAYDASIRGADVAVNKLISSEMARLKAAGVEQSEINKLALLYKDVWEAARRRAEEHRKAIEDLTVAMAAYQAQVVKGFTTTDALEERAIARRAAEDRRRQQFTNLGGTLTPITLGGGGESRDDIARDFQEKALRKFNDTIEATENVSRAFGELADVLGDMGPLVEGALRGFESFANGLSRFKAGQSQGGTLGMLAQVSGAIGMAAGALQVVRGLFDDSERDALLKQNNEALDRLRQSLENPATFGDTLTTLATIDAIQARPGFKNNQRPSEITRFSEDERKAIKEAADRFGIDVFDKNGKIVRTALQQLEDALRDSALSVTEFGKTVAGQKTLRDAFNEIFDITDPGQLLQSEFDQLAQRSGGLFGDLKNLDLTSGTGRDVLETRIRDLITKAMGGDLTATDLSGFSSVQEFIDSLLSIDHGLDAFSEGLNKATSAVTDIPKAINLALYERRFGSGLGPSPRDARDTSPSIPGTPEFRANSGSGPTNTFYITIEGSEKPVGALFDEIEAESQRRVRGGGTVVLGRTSL